MPMLIQDLPVDRIVPDPGQPRKTHDADALARLAETVRLHGVETPICVHPHGDHWMIEFGERRWRASVLAGLKTIPAMVNEVPTGSSGLRIRQLLENCSRESLPPLGLAAAIEALIEDGLTAGEVARQIGISEGHVSKLRAGLRLPQDVRDAVARGELPLTAAYQLGKLGTDQAKSEAAAAAMSGGLSRDALARKIRKGQRAGQVGRKKVTFPVQPGCSLALVGKELSLPSVVELLTRLLDRARVAEAQGLSIDAFASSFRPAKPLQKPGAK